MTRQMWAVAIIAAFIGVLAGCAGASPSNQPSNSTSPTTAAASPTGLGTADIDRSLVAGTYRIAEPFAAPFSVTVPTGWRLGSLVQGDVSFNGPASDDPGWLVIELVENVFADPCQSGGGPVDPPVSPTVDGIVGALTEMVGFNAGPVTDVVVGTHTGKAFDLTNGIDTNHVACYGVQMLPLWTYAGGGEAATGGGARERIWVVDVEGTPVIVDRGGSGVDEVATTLAFGTPVAVVPTASPVATPTEPHLTYVALGDSLLFALEEDCDSCTSATVIYGQKIEAVLDKPVEVHNLTMHNGLKSAGLRAFLEDGAKIGRHPEDVFAAVTAADIVSVTIGFNDFDAPPGMSDPAKVVGPFKANLDAILSRIEALRAGQPTAVLVTQIYNNGGAAWTPIVEAQNQVICDMAVKHDAACVDIYHPFNGPDGSGSPAALGYLGPDGTHPSQRGMEVIAAALTESGFPPWR